jgi:putative membrane-bound dehydrogenase-like protein
MPDVLLLLDHDGDDLCDERRLLFTGFGTGDTHAGPSNFRLGPDGWIWGTVGYSGFRGDVGGERLDFSQAIFRFKPDGSRLERVASTTNNTWGLGFSSHGEVFASTANGEHLVHVVLPAQALEELPGLPINATTHVEDHERLHSLLPLRQVDYFGGYTAACNAAISTNRAFPPEYFDRVAFVCEPTGHVVHRCLLERSGATFTSHDGWNMLASQDEWTAPVAAEPGPDGALWVLDWYSPVVQHNPTPRGFTTGKGNAYETPHRDKQHGRIWRIVWRGEVATPQPEAPPRVVLTEDPWPPPSWRLVDSSGAPLALAAAPAKRALQLFDFVSDRTSGRDPWPGLAATLEAAKVWRQFLAAALVSATVPSDGNPAAAAPANLIANPSAEDLDGAAPRGWRSVTYGGRADFAVADSGHGGAHALRITSTGGADASWSQAVKVAPDATYRLTGWIKTENVEPLGGANGALFNVHELQAPKLVKTPAVVGTGDWTKVEVTFESGRHETLTINALLGGWGAARGTACFDDVELTLVRSLPPKWRAVRAVAAYAARTAPSEALALLPALLPAAVEAKGAVLEGFAEGWPRATAPTHVALDDAATAVLKEIATQLPPAERAPLLQFAERGGVLAAFPAELESLTGELQRRLADPAVTREAKSDAARRLLALAPGVDSVDRVAAGLTPLTEPDLAFSLIAALGESGIDAAGDALLERIPQLTPQSTAFAVEALLRRPRWQELLLKDVLAGRVDKLLIATDVLDRLLKSGDPKVAGLAAEVAKRSGRVPNPDRQKLLEKWLPLADRPGDFTRGAVVFGEQCAKCHALNDKGGVVGPDLTNIGTRGKHDLLLEILDPNRSVEGTYRAYDVTMKNGDTFSGRMVGESRTTLELLDATGAKHVISREEAREVAALSRSLMPEGFEDLGEVDLGGLLEFLTRIAKPGR